MELARRLKGTGVTANFLHPGIVDTPIFHKIPYPLSLLFIGRSWMKTPEEGARTTVYVATAPELEGVSGQYFRDISKISALRYASSFDEGSNKEIFEISKKLVMLRDSDPQI